METMIEVDQLDQWLAGEFVALNTRIEQDPGERPDLAAELLVDGAKLVAAVAGTGELPADPDDRYRLLGSVGGYLAACRRHGVGDPGTLAPAWSLAQRLGDDLGVAPRYVFAHQCLYGYRTFTDLPGEHAFVTGNAVAALGYRRAAEALRTVALMGVASPAADYLLDAARVALEDVLVADRTLAAELDVDTFFGSIRPYFLSYRVGEREYRGTNGGDFAAINEIDLLLGLCGADDPGYRRVLDEKRPFLPPGEQAVLDAATRRTPLPDRFLERAADGPLSPPDRTRAELLLAVCRAHAAASSFHHHRLVLPYLVAPAGRAEVGDGGQITTSGSPLDAVVGGLRRLVELRSGRRNATLDRLRELVGRAAHRGRAARGSAHSTAR
jgi:hypothetical protein